MQPLSPPEADATAGAARVGRLRAGRLDRTWPGAIRIDRHGRRRRARRGRR